MSNAELKMFQTVFENSPVGLVVVNGDTTLRDVNHYMFKNFKLTPEAVTGYRFGNLFNCAAVYGAGLVCGETEQCAHCGLKNGMQAVLKDGVTIPDSIMEHGFIIEGVEQKKWFIISASRIVTEDDNFAIVSFSDITTQKEFEELLNNQLSLDMATGVTNKYALLNSLKSLSVGKESLTIALIDFDDFKLINDTYGHLAGDRVLEIFCACATANTRKQDILGRFGGEEFMIIFPRSSAGMMIKVLQRIATSTKELCENELGIRVSFSAGLTEYSRESIDGMDVNALIAEVDVNLYQAKKSGKNMIFFNGMGIPFA